MQNDFTVAMKDKTDYFSEEEVKKILNYFIEQGKLRDYMLFMTLYRTQRRISEVLGSPPYKYNQGLRPIDIHPDMPLIEFDILKKNPIKTKTKSGTERSKDILDKLRFEKRPVRKLKAIDKAFYQELKQYINQQGISPETRIFPITRQRADQILKQAAKACNIQRANKGIHCHQFRHTFSIHYLKAHPLDPTALLKLNSMLEHSKIEITKTYTQFTQHDIRESLDEMFQNFNIHQ